MERYVCVHGHFYQPPRENPWLEAIELQDSAYPYHDWNERITAECYLPNATSRILNADGWITQIQNNYSSISYNFGPTLLAWMEEKAPEVDPAILAADRESRKKFSGHGSALAQVYSHMIACSRRHGRREILVAAPRLVAGLTGGEERAPLGKDAWGDTRLLRGSQYPGQTYRNLFTGEMISAGTAGNASGLRLAEIFAAFPVALLEAVRG